MDVSHIFYTVELIPYLCSVKELNFLLLFIRQLFYTVELTELLWVHPNSNREQRFKRPLIYRLIYEPICSPTPIWTEKTWLTVKHDTISS